MIDKINNDKLPEFVEKPTNLQPERVVTHEDGVKGDSIQVQYADLIEQAKEVSQSNLDAVQQAKLLLSSGKLDTPENILAAAENIIKFGI